MNNDFDVVFQGLELLLFRNEAFKQLVVFKSRLKYISQSILNGLISKSEETLELNKIRNGLIDLILNTNIEIEPNIERRIESYLDKCRLNDIEFRTYHLLQASFESCPLTANAFNESSSGFVKSFGAVVHERFTKKVNELEHFRDYSLVDDVHIIKAKEDVFFAMLNPDSEKIRENNGENLMVASAEIVRAILMGGSGTKKIIEKLLGETKFKDVTKKIDTLFYYYSQVQDFYISYSDFDFDLEQKLNQNTIDDLLNGLE